VSSRDEILARVRTNQPGSRPLPVVPSFERDVPSLAQAFKANLARMGGAFLEPPSDTDLGKLIRERFPDARVICSATREVAGNRPIDRTTAPAELDDVDVGVVRAAFGVAETGSLWLSEAALLDPTEIVPNLHHAYRHRGFFTARYAVFMTGPSATADIEGVLIRGAQGIRSLTVVAVPRASR
jgi:L-lactate dehydrogenase complex protein LldG